MSPRITYRLSAPATLTFHEVERLVGDMREQACRLRFPAMSPVFCVSEEQCAYANWRSLPDELLWMVVQNAKLVAEPFCPAELAGFTVLPAERAEWAAFGFCRFERGNRGNQLPPACEQVLDNRWYWSAWCSTQHAANLKYGGTGNFLRGHLSVIRMLEFCRQGGWLSDVRDPFGYRSHRDERKLLENVPWV